MRTSVNQVAGIVDGARRKSKQLNNMLRAIEKHCMQ